MALYELLIKPFIRRMDLESASKVALRYYKVIGKIPGGRTINRWVHRNRSTALQREVFGLQFYNPLGMGAGLDLDGDLYNDLNNLGFSFTEIGPLDAGGVRHAVKNIQKDPRHDILAICIDDDFLTSFTLAYDFCDFFVIELSPSDPSTDVLDPLLNSRLTEQNYRPIVVKIPEVITTNEIDEIIDYCMMNGVDGIEVRSLEQIETVRKHSKSRLEIIANSHIDTPQLASQALQAGASLIEIRTGVIRNGPKIVHKISKYLTNLAKNERNGTK